MAQRSAHPRLRTRPHVVQCPLPAAPRKDDREGRPVPGPAHVVAGHEKRQAIPARHTAAHPQRPPPTPARSPRATPNTSSWPWRRWSSSTSPSRSAGQKALLSAVSPLARCTRTRGTHAGQGRVALTQRARQSPRCRTGCLSRTGLPSPSRTLATRCGTSIGYICLSSSSPSRALRPSAVGRQPQLERRGRGTRSRPPWVRKR